MTPSMKTTGASVEEEKVAKDNDNGSSAKDGKVATWHKRTMKKRKTGCRCWRGGRVAIALEGDKHESYI